MANYPRRATGTLARVDDPRFSAIAAALDSRPDELVWVRAPGRVNLMGDHTDYHDGLVLPMAIDRDCLIGARRRSDGRVRARSLEEPLAVELDLRDADAVASEAASRVEPSWGRFVAGALAAMGVSATGLSEQGFGFDLALSSTVPPASGLSSSSALTVALVLVLAEMAGLESEPTDAARTARRAEILATGVPGGLMDQLTSLYGRAGHALSIDCRTLAIEPIPVPGDLAVVAVHSGQPRVLATTEYAARRAEGEAAATRLGVTTLRDATREQVTGDPMARHVVSENARVAETAEALRADDQITLGRLFAQSHASLRDDCRVSTTELDALVDALVDAGAVGARLTGAGFGGCVVALVERGDVAAVTGRAVANYRTTTGLEASVFEVTAADGAGVAHRPPPASSTSTA